MRNTALKRHLSTFYTVCAYLKNVRQASTMGVLKSDLPISKPSFAGKSQVSVSMRRSPNISPFNPHVLFYEVVSVIR